MRVQIPGRAASDFVSFREHVFQSYLHIGKGLSSYSIASYLRGLGALREASQTPGYNYSSLKKCQGEPDKELTEDWRFESNLLQAQEDPTGKGLTEPQPIYYHFQEKYGFGELLE